MCNVVVIVSLSVSLLLRAPLAVAAEPLSADAVFAQAEADWDGHNYFRSLRHLEAAYRLFPDPRLHYNMARCWQRLNQPHAELKELELWVDTDRYWRDREVGVAAEQRIIELRKRLRPLPIEERPIYKQWWFWTLVGTAAAGMAMGVALVGRTFSPGSGNGDPPWPAVPIQFNTASQRIMKVQLSF